MRPKPAFLEWMNNTAIFSLLPLDKQTYLHSQSLESMRSNSTLIAIPLIRKQTDDDIDHLIDSIASDMLDAELERWRVPVHARPPKMTSALLKNWFDVTCHSRIFYLD